VPYTNPTLRLVIFDVDGTLIDSQNFILAAMRRAFAHAERPVPPDEATLGIVGLSLPQAMEVLVPGVTGAGRDRLVQLYKDSFRALRDMLDSHGLRQLFIGTQTADDAPSKPHPGMVLNCIAATGVERHHAVVVGDTEYDMAMARAAGARAVGVDWGYHSTERMLRGGAEHIIEDFSALDAVLEEIWESA
jgi:phosphoglycolate phosphatase